MDSKKKEPAVRVYSRGDGWAVTTGHDTNDDGLCWCDPVLVHTTVSGRKVWAHRRPLDVFHKRWAMPPKRVVQQAIREAEDAI